MSALFSLARRDEKLPEKSRAAVDATGLESQYISRYYVWRRGVKRHRRVRWPKLTVVCEIASHFWLGAHVCIGPCQDSPQFPPVLRQAAGNQRIDELLGDKGYDAEHNHRLCREELGVRTTIIPLSRRNQDGRSWPQTPYRREMKHRHARVGYGQRWQAESAFSRHKRRLGPTLRARTWLMQEWECFLRVLTHNVMLLAA